MSGRRPAIKGVVWIIDSIGCGHVFGLLSWAYSTGPDVCPLICWPPSP